MSKPIIAIDADDTLFDEITAVRQFMNDVYGLNQTAEEYSVPGNHADYFQTIWGLSESETVERYSAFVKSDYKYDMLPLPNAIDTLNYLKKSYELVIVTARHGSAEDMTRKSLEDHYPNIFEDVHFSPMWDEGKGATKAKICNDIGAEYLIDDSFDHCKLAADRGVTALFFGDYGWSKQGELTSDMHKVLNWMEVREYFEKR